MYNILIVEDQAMTSKLLELMISSNKNYNVIKTITDASYAEMIVDNMNIDLIIMDVLTNGSLNGLEASEILKKKYPNLKIIIVTSMPEHSYLNKAMKIGVEGLFYKDYSDDTLLNVMDKILNGEKYFPQSTPIVMIGDMPSNEFSKRDLDVLRLLMDGKTDREISDALHFSIDTIHLVVKELLSKTGFKTRTRLAVATREAGLIIN